VGYKRFLISHWCSNDKTNGSTSPRNTKSSSKGKNGDISTINACKSKHYHLNVLRSVTVDMRYELSNWAWVIGTY
jgi:hypothetical protein